MSDRDLYRVLGVDRSADISDIKSAYKQLAKEHHPDKGGDQEKFKEIGQAYEILSDDGRRKMYDMTGSTSEQPNGMGRGGDPFGGMPFPMHEMFGGMFGGMFPGGPGGPGGSGRRREGKSPGKTQELPLRIIDYYKGRNLSIKLGRHTFCNYCKGSGASSTETCGDCGGQGQIRQMVQMGPIQMLSHGPCHMCQGKGKKHTGKCDPCQGRGLIPEEKNLDIKIEAGMMSGNTIVFPGMCSDNPGFTEAGDVTIVLREADEEGDSRGWVREGNRLKTSLTINLTEALLGTTKVLKGHPGFPDGVPIEIPVGVQNMWTGTIPTLGMPVRGTPKFGEAYVSILVIPTQEELDALKKQTMLIKTILPSIPSPEQCPESVRSGRWSGL
ncbi:MAG: J domain-containing protein [Bacteroidetes bacterium]|jgi:DnaJ-class molecular chaperone|nr:J domain-containing protein [Bacteroidota bacterium]